MYHRFNFEMVSYEMKKIMDLVRGVAIEGIVGINLLLGAGGLEEDLDVCRIGKVSKQRAKGF